MFCKSGKHFWTNPADAEKCCNGYKRVLVLGGGDNQQEAGGIMCGRAWVAESLPNTACSGLAPTAPQTTKVNQGASRSRKPLGGFAPKEIIWHILTI